MDTEATRPRARIGYMRRGTGAPGAAASVDPDHAVGPVDTAAAVPALEALRDHTAMLRRSAMLAKQQREQLSLRAQQQEEAADEDIETVVPHSLVRGEPLPSDNWLKRLFAASRTARYRWRKRAPQVGRHEDVSV